ncbi:TolC family protein [Oleiharenicola lentus]|uniref:TolC family protein n=1 Tax=Oleiharenicola lentus TaxID=2508720 RepID=A0A4Q1CA46_9BACT|nr:TolC family protein [Oleiharenicola lentus]RXK55736.1 TolC family protein [Oleiharenicola lentus]
MKFSRLLVAGVVLTGGLFVQAFAQDVVTVEKLYPELDNILKQAVAQSPRMLSRAIDLEIAENDRIAARAGLLPTVGGAFRYYEARERRADLGVRMSVPKTYYDFSISQPLYHWGERTNTARMGEIREFIAQGNYREGYRLFAQEVRNAYLKLIVDKLRAKRSAYALDYANNQLKQGEERLAQKVISEGQMFVIRIDAERAQVTAERAAFEFESGLASFARLTGAPLRAEAVPDVIPPVKDQGTALNSLVQGYLAQSELPSHEAVSLRNTLDLERLNLANHKTRLKPKFSLVAGANQDEQRYTALGSKYKVDSYYAGVSVGWTIFDGFSARSAVRSSLARLRSMESDYRVLTDRLAQHVQSQARLAGFAARSAAINNKLLDSAEGNLSEKTEQFSRGAVAQEQVNLAQLNLYDMQLTAYLSRIEYFTHVSELLGTVREDPVLANLPAGK